MDLDTAVMTKRMAYEQILDDTRTELIKVIHNEKLVSQNGLETVKAMRWGKQDEH
jgi:hypothetical protein